MLTKLKKIDWELLEKVALIHACEDIIISKYPEDQMKTPMHMSRGDENCVVGIVSAFLDDSYFFGYYRSHSLYLAVTHDAKTFFAEMLGRATGSNGGLAGSMHLTAPDCGLLATSAIVSSTIPLALGGGLAAVETNEKKYSIVFFGDGALEEGVFHETLNMACLLELPIIFVCLDNDLAVDLEAKERQGFKSIKKLVSAYECHYVQLKQPTVFEAFNAACDVKKRFTARKGPVFFHMKYYRYLQHIGTTSDFQKNHSKFEKSDYRSKKQYERQLKQMPLQQSLGAGQKLGFRAELLEGLVQNAKNLSLEAYNLALSDPILPIETLPEM